MKKRFRNRQDLGRNTLLASSIAAVLAMPTVVWAQSVASTLRGTAPANAVVTAKNVASGTVRHTTAGSDGRYTLSGLPPGTYRIDAGSGTEQTVTLAIGSTIAVDLAAGAAAASEGASLEEIIVNSRRPVEVKTSGNLHHHFAARHRCDAADHA